MMYQMGEDRLKEIKRLQFFGHISNEKIVSETYCLELLKYDGLLLKHTTVQTINMIETALQQNGLALNYVLWDDLAKHRSEVEMEELRSHFYRIAIQQNPYAIKYVHNPSEDLCLETLRCDLKEVWDVDYPDPLIVIDSLFELTPRMVFEAVRQSGGRIRHIPQVFRTPRLWLEAMKQDSEVIDYWLEEKGLDSKELEELIWLIGVTKNEYLWDLSLIPFLTGEFKWLAAIGPRYRKDRPIQQSFYRLTDEMTLLMENFMFDCPNEVNPEPFFSTYINQQYERKSMAQTLELNPMVLMLMENRFKSFRLCRYAMRLIAKEEKGLLNELKRHSPYHLLEVLEAR